MKFSDRREILPMWHVGSMRITKAAEACSGDVGLWGGKVCKGTHAI